MLTDDVVLDIQNIIHNCNSFEELQEKLKMYFLTNWNNVSNVDPAHLAWGVYNNIIQNKSIKDEYFQ
jgi:hypothetical protein